MLTVILPVRNEEANIGAALESVSWADELIVVDSHSTDATAALAAAAGARVVQFDYDGAGPKKKRWTLDNVEVRNAWILMLDADERVTPDLRTEIERAVESGEKTGWYIDRELWFMGRRMRSFRPNWNMRLFRAGSAQMEDLELENVPETGDNEIHEHFTVDGPTGYLHAPLLHNDYRGLSAWIDRHNRYATWEAHLYRKFRDEPLGASAVDLLRLDAFTRKRILRRIWVRLPFRPSLRFFVWYVLRRGFLDGRQGYLFCRFMAWYELLIGAKLRELDG